MAVLDTVDGEHAIVWHVPRGNLCGVATMIQSASEHLTLPDAELIVDDRRARLEALAARVTNPASV